MNNTQKFLVALVTPIVDLEAAWQQLLVNRSVNTAFGATLDLIGKQVGQARAGLSDDVYRRYIRARIATHRSTGTIEDLIKVVNLIVYDDAATIKVTNEGTATARLQILGAAITDALAAIVHAFALRTKSGGVRIVTEWSTGSPAAAFQFDGPTGTGFDDAPFAGDLSS